MWLPLYLISKIFQCWYAILPSQIYFLWWRHQCFRWHSSVKTLFLENIFVKYSLVGCTQVCTTGIVSKIGDICHQHLKLSPTLKVILNEQKCIHSDCAKYRSILCCCKSAENAKISVKVNCILCNTYNLDSFIFMNSGC